MQEGRKGGKAGRTEGQEGQKGRKAGRTGRMEGQESKKAGKRCTCILADSVQNERALRLSYLRDNQ